MNIKDNKKILSKNDTSEVYEIEYNKEKVILKIHKNEEKFNNEVKFLKMLSGKDKIFPVLIKYENLFYKEGYGYIIESKIFGVNLLDKYDKLNENQKLDILREAAKNLAYLNTLPIKVEDSYFDWKEYFYEKIPNWVNNIRGDKGYKEIGNFLMTELKRLDKKSETLGIIHRDYGFRNLLVNDKNIIVGILDFEHAMIGDILFDTTKLIFNNINFFEKEKVDIFLNEWKKQTKITIDEEKLFIYLSIQGLGVVQWCDIQKDYVLHEKYRKKGEKILFYSLEKLKFKNI